MNRAEMELKCEIIKLRHELATKQAQLNRFLKFLSTYENDLPEITENNTILEMNLTDNLKDIIKEAKNLFNE